jgi:LysR family glycine cleavage system transcriptional activator
MVPTLPSLQALRILDSAARLRSYSGAADELGLTHGAVSRQIQGLEHWSGSKLFERSGRRMEPTSAGLALATRTREALAMLGDVALAKAAASSPDSGLVVSTTPAFARFWLIPRLGRLNAEHPGLVREIEAEATFFESGRRKVDIAIRYGRGGWSDVEFERIAGPDGIFPVAAPALANAHRGDLAEALRRTPVIETPYNSWRNWLAKAGLEITPGFRIALKASDSNLALEMCIAGCGIALARARLAARELLAGRLVPLHAALLTDTYEYYAVWRSNSRQRRSIATLKSWLAREMADNISGPEAQSGRPDALGARRR